MREPTETTNLDRYGHDALQWSRALDQLTAGPLSMDVAVFLGTVRPDGRPHAAGIGAAWHDDTVYFTSGPGTRKSKNLEHNPAATISLRLKGLDLILEGEAHRVTDPDTVAQLAAVFREGGWPAEADGDALTAPFSAPSAGPPPWYVYRFTCHTAFAVAFAEPDGATRWRFAV